MKLKTLILKLLLKKENKEKIDKSKIEKILFIRNAKIGDAICSFPLLRELSKNFPSSTIDVYASTYSNFLFEKVSYCNKVFTKYRTKHFFKTLFQIFLMRKQRYDLVVLAMPMKFGLELSTWFINPRWTISIGKQADSVYEKKLGISREDLSFYDALKIENKNEHMVDYLLSMLLLLDIKEYSNKMEFPFDKEKFDYAQNFLKNTQKSNFIALNIDSANKRQCLYEKQIVEISNLLKNRYIYIYIIIFSLPSRSEEVKNIIEKNNLSNCILSYPTKTIFDAAELLRNCKILITPDTGILHIASALNIPTVGIYRQNESNFNFWYPKSDMSYVVRSKFDKQEGIEVFDINEVISSVDTIVQTLKLENSS